jgi:aryl-alcohol dehydrogenase-like predicted oxidoreductase
MRTRSLGEGGPEVSVVGLGTNNFGRRCDYDQTLAVIDAALDAGVTLLDTADIYGQGMSEEYIGRALEGRRDQVVIATKFGSAMDERPEERRGNPDYIRWAVEGSLRRLRTDVIDVYQMHQPDPVTPIVETLGALNDLVAEGKIRWIGSSNFSADQIETAEEVSRGAGFDRFVSAQNHYRSSRSRAGCSPASTRAARRRPRGGSPGARSRTSSGIAPRLWSRMRTRAGSRCSTSRSAACSRCRR